MTIGGRTSLESASLTAMDILTPTERPSDSQAAGQPPLQPRSGRSRVIIPPGLDHIPLSDRDNGGFDRFDVIVLASA
jgi:hypothetical protein